MTTFTLSEQVALLRAPDDEASPSQPAERAAGADMDASGSGSPGPALGLPATPTLQAWRQGSRSAHRQEVHSPALQQGGPAQLSLSLWQPMPGSGSGFAERGGWPHSQMAGPAYLTSATLAGLAPVDSPAASGAPGSGTGSGPAPPEQLAPLGDPAAAAERALAALQAANVARHAELDWRAQNGKRSMLCLF